MRRHSYYDAPPLVQWRAVFAGAVIGLGTLILLSVLWAAIGLGGHHGSISMNFRWWLAGSAIFAMFLGAYFAGFFSGVRGAAAGFANAATLWGISVLVVMLGGVPAVMRIFNVHVAGLGSSATSAVAATSAAATSAGAATGVPPHVVLWTSFWAIVIGLGAALIGGLFGGSMPRAVSAAEPMAYEEPRSVGTREYRRTGTEH